MLQLPFIKMHGAGNDYVFIDAIQKPLSVDVPKLAREMSHRRKGIGSDGLVIINASDVADVKMNMYNADGSESENCGNALRCIAKYVFDAGICPKKNLKIETGAGVFDTEIFPGADSKAAQIQVQFPEPKLLGSAVSSKLPAEKWINRELDFGSVRLKATLVSMGNPHAVFFTDNVDTVPLDVWGPAIENHPLFSDRTNVEFVQVIDEKRLIQRTWERGSGETWACGTGAAAVCVAGKLTGNSGPHVAIRLKGGTLELSWTGEGSPVFMKGEAVEVYRGIWQQMGIT